MFGTYRTLLALLVVAQHLGGVPVIGAYAVFGFYVLSGYLMTLIMHTNYGYDRAGLGRYLANRCLRIYPAYWVSIAFTAILVLWLGKDVTSFYHQTMYMPESIVDILKNIFLIFPDLSPPRMTPPAWALTVELFFYLLIGLGLSRTLRRVQYWLLASVLYHSLISFVGLGWDHRYFTIPAASLPFAAGAMVYHHRDRLKAVLQRYQGRFADCIAPVIFAIFLLNWVVGVKLKIAPEVSFYLSFSLCVLMLIVLASRPSLPWVSKRLDSFLGDFSYPIYLLHYQVGLVVISLAGWLGLPMERPSEILLILSLPLLFLVCWGFSTIVEKPIELLRAQVKRS